MSMLKCWTLCLATIGLGFALSSACGGDDSASNRGLDDWRSVLVFYGGISNRLVYLWRKPDDGQHNETRSRGQ